MLAIWLTCGSTGAGNIPHLMRPDYHVQALEWANKYGGICRFSLGGQWIVLVSDPQLVAQLLGRGPNSLPRKCIGYSFFDMATNHLGLRSFFTTTDEEQWALIRKGTAQAFSQANIRQVHSAGIATPNRRTFMNSLRWIFCHVLCTSIRKAAVSIPMHEGWTDVLLWCCLCRRYFVYALKHAQELAEQVKLAASASKQGIVEVQEQVLD